MFGWLTTSFIITAIGAAFKKSDRVKYNRAVQSSPAKLTKPVKYQNRMKQAMYEKYLRELAENPEWAMYKLKHGEYCYKFDNTEE